MQNVGLQADSGGLWVARKLIAVTYVTAFDSFSNWQSFIAPGSTQDVLRETFHQRYVTYGSGAPRSLSTSGLREKLSTVNTERLLQMTRTRCELS